MRHWPMPFCKTQGIVVRKVHFSESSLILTFLTREFGKIDTLAKGAKRCGKKMPGVLDLLCMADIVFLQKSSELYTLTEWEVRDYFPGLRRDLARLYAADYAAELIRDTTEEEPCPEVFDLLVEVLSGLANACDLVPWIFAFELKLLTALGYMPALARCAECDGMLGPEAFFSPVLGGAVCLACRTDSCVPVSAGSRATMLSLVRAEFAHLDRFRIAPVAQDEIRRLIHRHIEYSIGRRPRLWSYLTP